MISEHEQSPFGFTPTETRLVLHLIKGDCLRTAASALNMKYETARTHLKSIFLKTDTHRQTELIIAVLNTVDKLSPQLEDPV